MVCCMYVCRSRCRSGVPLAEDVVGIGSLCVWDLQPGIPEGPEPSDAPAEAQGAVEAVEEGNAGGEEESVCMPGA